MAEKRTPAMNPETGDVVVDLNEVKRAVEEAPPAPDLPSDSEPPPARGRGVPPRLPADCPVTPLGRMGREFYYLNSEYQLTKLMDKDHGRLPMQAMFGENNEYLKLHWPRGTDKNGDVKGWRTDDVSELLMAAASRAGIWDPFKRQRGRGAWRGDHGELVLHCGDEIFVGARPAEAAAKAGGQMLGTWHKPGLVGRYIYAGDEPMPRPAALAQEAGERGPAVELLNLLKTWNWNLGETGARLMLGWIGAALLGGALAWRPLAWLTGGQGTGKSTLIDLLKGLMGEALVWVSDATAAGIWQEIGRQTIPVAFDELEAETDNRATNKVVKLARQASSGGQVLRGGADHKSTTFEVRSCFLFNAILVPPMMGQDRSRMALLELGDLDQDQSPPVLALDRLRHLGEGLRRRQVDQWARWDDTLRHFREGLIQAGHSARGADQYGTLLAAADLLLHDNPPHADATAAWIEPLSPAALASVQDDGRDEEKCLTRLMTTVIDPYRKGKSQTVGEWLHTAAHTDMTSGDAGDAEEAARALARYGLRAVEGPDGLYLAVANTHEGVASIYRDSHWASRSGGSSVWVQALRRLAGAINSGTDGTKTSYWFAGAASRAVLIPLATVERGKEG